MKRDEVKQYAVAVFMRNKKKVAREYPKE